MVEDYFLRQGITLVKNHHLSVTVEAKSSLRTNLGSPSHHLVKVSVKVTFCYLGKLLMSSFWRFDSKEMLSFKSY